MNYRPKLTVRRSRSRRSFFGRHPVASGIASGLAANVLQDLAHSSRVRRLVTSGIKRLPKLWRAL